MPNRLRLASLAAISTVLLGTGVGIGTAAAGSLELPPTPPYERSYPLLGDAVALRVLDDDGRPVRAAVVEVVYRPNSQTVHRAELAPTGEDGTTAWTPEYAGIVALTAHAGAAGGPTVASAQVAVRYGGFPASGLAVMLVAGVLLFGGALLGFVELMRGGAAPPAAAGTPST